MYIYIYIHTHIYVMYVCMYACMHACMHGCMYVCMYVCIANASLVMVTNKAEEHLRLQCLVPKCCKLKRADRQT